jgi:hypothetical protein
LVSNLLKKNGEFVYTAFNDTAVINLLRDNGGEWLVTQNNVKKYHIIKKYKGITGADRKIKLILPFNRSDYYYDENLINDSLVEKAFAKHNIKKIKSGSFIEYLNEFKQKKYNFYKNLTDADKTFISLYSYTIYRK